MQEGDFVVFDGGSGQIFSSDPDRLPRVWLVIDWSFAMRRMHEEVLTVVDKDALGLP